MRVEILEIGNKVFSGEVQSLNVKTTSGEITILDHHRPLVTTLIPSVAVLTSADGKEIVIPVSGGFLEVNHKNEVTVLADK